MSELKDKSIADLRGIVMRDCDDGRMGTPFGVEAFDELASRYRKAEEDAKRYRWLKKNHLQTGADSWIRTGDDLEEAIDAAIEYEKQARRGG